MIELDRTDEEREELVKKWIADYWLVVVGGVVLAVALLYGWNYYQQSQRDALSDTALRTEQVLQALANGNIDTAAKQVEVLQASYSDSSFAALTTLQLAKHWFDVGKYEKASAQYDWLITHAGDAAMRDLARLRQARSQANAKQYDRAIMTLGGIEKQDYLTESHLLKGDIYLADNQFSAARKAYESAQQDTSINPQSVQQRLNLLTIKQQKASQ